MTAVAFAIGLLIGLVIGVVIPLMMLDGMEHDDDR